MSILRNKIRMQIGYAQPLPIRCTCTGILQHALARPLDHTCSGIELFHFIPRTPPMDDKISQSGFVQGTNETFVQGFFLNIGMCPGVKIAMSRGCYTEKKCV